MQGNEVILDRLFRPTKKIEIAERPLVVRALSGPEQEARAFYATSQARKLDKELADHESPSYQARLEFLENKGAEELSLFLKLWHENDFRRVAEKENEIVYTPIPDEATDEEKRSTMDAREKSIEEHKAKVDAIVQAKVDEYAEKNLSGKSQEELLKIAKAEISGPYLNERANMAYVHYSLYASVQQPDGSRYFLSPEDVSNMERNIIFNIFDEVKVINEIDPLALNSNGASSTE
jgi:hypothetical protein